VTGATGETGATGDTDIGPTGPTGPDGPIFELTAPAYTYVFTQVNESSAPGGSNIIANGSPIPFMADIGTTGFTTPIASGATSIVIPFDGYYFISFGCSVTGLGLPLPNYNTVALAVNGTTTSSSTILSNLTMGEQCLIYPLVTGDVITLNNISPTGAAMALGCFSAKANPSSTGPSAGADVTAYLSLLLIE